MCRRELVPPRTERTTAMETLDELLIVGAGKEPALTREVMDAIVAKAQKLAKYTADGTDRSIAGDYASAIAEEVLKAYLRHDPAKASWRTFANTVIERKACCIWNKVKRANELARRVVPCGSAQELEGKAVYRGREPGARIDAANLRRAVRRIVAAIPRAREKRIAKMVLSGVPMAEIARREGMARSQVSFRLGRLAFRFRPVRRLAWFLQQAGAPNINACAQARNMV